MEEKFTIKEFKNYILSKDSMGDILHYLNADNVRKANQPEEEKNVDECVNYDFCEGRELCCHPNHKVCKGICEDYTNVYFT